MTEVYFQPPPNLQMTFPCIVYRRDDEDTHHASNKVYKRKTRYQVTIIDRDPDSTIPKAVAELPLCAFNRFFITDNLNHDVYNIYF